MVEDIGQEIYNAIKKDNLELFEKHVNEEHAKELSFGRFPILSLCYLYNAKKIIKKYEDELLLLRTYVQIPEKIETYSLFKKKAGRNLRLYAGTNNIIHPLEMLSILGKASRLEKVYPKAIKTNSTIENLKTIEMVKSSTEINPTETKIQMPKQKIPKKLYKISISIMAVCLVFAIVFSLAAVGVVALGDGSENHPYYVRSVSQLEEAISKGKYIVLDSDIECESLSIGDYDGNIDGNSHTIKLTNQTTNIFKNFTGSIKNLNIDIQLDFANNASSGILTYKNSGTIDNVNITINGKMKYTGAAVGTSIMFALISSDNSGTISNVTINGALEIEGNITSDVEFGAIAGANTGSIKTIKTSGTFTFTEANGAMGVFKNDGDVDSFENSASLYQTSNAYSTDYANEGRSLRMGGIVSINYGTVSNSINTGDITIEDKNEQGVYSIIGGVTCVNLGTIQKCKNTATLTSNVNYAIARTGSICGDSEIDGKIPSIKECAGLGTIVVSVESDRSRCFVGGLVGCVFGSYNNTATIADSYSAIQTQINGTYTSICRGGIVGFWPSTYGDGLSNNAYLQSNTVPYGLYVSGYFAYEGVVSSQGMFANYENMSDIEALEIYW